ncbi:MAG TPA: hypothetical protein VFB54_06620 [Burkholderiales bacterium]|nr:hypothetical protein [Burkholderiales bacterium]
MNAKTILFIAAIFASSGALAESYGRDSVYAKSGTTTSKPSKGTAVAGNGRSSVYATDLPAPSRSTEYAATISKFGRA